MDDEGAAGKLPNGQKGRDIRDVILVAAVSALAAYQGLDILRAGDKDGFLILALAAFGLYFIVYRVFKYIKLYTKWM